LSVPDDGQRDATEMTNGPGRRSNPDPVISVAVALALAGIAVARIVQRTVDVGPAEGVLFRARPRRDTVRFLLSLGMWEFRRRSTQYVVTPRRLIIERGLLVRRTESIPLSQIHALDVVEAPWQRTVELRGVGGSRLPARIGPLDAGAARGLAAAVSAAAARR
jgi:membrane protein YdbS with pleckstrin-like domain